MPSREEAPYSGCASDQRECEVRGDDLQHHAGRRRVEGGVPEHGSVVHPPGQRGQRLGSVSRFLRDRLVGRVTTHCDDPGGCRVGCDPGERRLVEIERDDAAVGDESIHQRATDAAAGPGDDEGSLHGSSSSLPAAAWATARPPTTVGDRTDTRSSQ